ncbi:Lrp/AsnC family transcriptional regulator [Streptomyces sp. NBC_00083]|uniref:Lrp/AsnC family transcriptional regulator n=1 Tax=Streptomyces sp. NBC_00083 TaxID=2975647 RepID=UPI00225303BE|nr:Lrp/AsnC family transcriptional regulator [Streptomyces sp. NBC_00083]MCX5384180.1 Lrp/AsnC family transcriptional regulator [Streptomyces sp. NBC_00083]
MSHPEIADSTMLESDDVRILRALQIDPRVGFATVASVLGLSEPTIARRYRRMRRAGAIRVIGVVDPGALGQSRWMVRLRCRPGSATAIADALAQRDDVGWVALNAAGSEITCAVRSRSQEQRDDLLGRRLPRTAAVLDVQASVLLRQFVGGRGHYWAALAGTLTPEQESALGSGGNPFTERPVVRNQAAQLNAEDEKLLAALAADGRASLVDLAAAADLTPGRVSRRLHALLSDHVVHIDVEIAPMALGYRARANLWMRVHPGKVKAVGRAMALMPEVGFAAAVSGPYNLHAVVQCRDLDELFEFTTGRVGALPGVEGMEISPIVRQVKQAGTRVDGDRLTGPSSE